MPKNNMDTIFNTLDNIARKKELTRSDEKEIRRQLSSLLTEMANTSDKTLKTEYLDKYNKLKENHADALKAAEEALNEEQKASLAEIMQKSEDNKARVEENKERAEETNLNSNVRENTSAPAPQPEKVEENKAEETKTEETKPAEQTAQNAALRSALSGHDEGQFTGLTDADGVFRADGAVFSHQQTPRVAVWQTQRFIRRRVAVNKHGKIQQTFFEFFSDALGVSAEKVEFDARIVCHDLFRGGGRYAHGSAFAAAYINGAAYFLFVAHEFAAGFII